jgi:hypothetical protein
MDDLERIYLAVESIKLHYVPAPIADFRPLSQSVENAEWLKGYNAGFLAGLKYSARCVRTIANATLDEHDNPSAYK